MKIINFNDFKFSRCEKELRETVDETVNLLYDYIKSKLNLIYYTILTNTEDIIPLSENWDKIVSKIRRTLIIKILNNPEILSNAGFFEFLYEVDKYINDYISTNLSDIDKFIIELDKE